MTRVTIELHPVEIYALRKLAVVAQMLAARMTGQARREQQYLTDALNCVLADVDDQIEIEAARRGPTH